MNGLAIATYPFQDNKLRLSCAHLSGESDKHNIRIEDGFVVDFNASGLASVKKLVRKICNGNRVDVVLGAHRDLKPNASSLKELGSAIGLDFSKDNILLRAFLPEAPIDEFTIVKSLQISDVQDMVSNEKLVVLAAREFHRRYGEIRFTLIPDDANHLINSILKGPYSDKFGRELGRLLGHNVCLKNPGNANFAFGDVLATIIADGIDTRTGSRPEIVTAKK